MSGIGRMARIAGVAARHGAAAALGRWAPPGVLRRRGTARLFPTASLAPPERLRALFEALGGTFVKFGQMLSLQPDILSRPYCNALFKLLDDVPPFPFSEVERILEQELGAAAEALEELDPTPLASASVGQVHRARVAGRAVVVKVMRPSVDRDFASDLRLMRAAMWLIRTFRLRPLAWLLEPMGEFVAWTREELDYRFEARYAGALRGEEGADRDRPGRYVPWVLGRFTTRRTLVLEYLPGASLVQVLRARERGDEVLLQRMATRGFVPEVFAGRVIDNFIGDAFRHGLYHADLHPANLIVLPENTVGYIDFGITGVLSPYSRRHLMAMTLAMAEGDLDRLFEAYVMLSDHDAGSDLAEFRRGLGALAEGWYAVDGRGGRRLAANFTRVMTEMLHLSRRTRVMPERDIVKYIRSAIAIDGLITRLAPSYDLARHLARACSAYRAAFARAAALRPERLLEVSATGYRLLREGPARMRRLLDDFGATGARTSAARPAPPVPARTAGLAAAVSWSIWLLATGPGSGPLVALQRGLFAATLALLAADLFLLATGRARR